MTRDEIREKIAKSIAKAIMDYFGVRKTMDKASHDEADEILALLKEEGWKLPEEVTPKQWLPSASDQEYG
jgi:hypothetical protein